jgi:CheY-like chemotaxis protein
MGVAKTVSKPTSREVLRAICEDTLSPDRGTAAAHAVLGEPTLEELGDRLAAEIRAAIVGAADPSARSRRIALGQGTEVLGAVWSAIARVREVVTARSDGHVRFASGPAGALTPAPLLLDPEIARADRMRQTKRGLAAEVRLQGRRVVVADDDPAVVWFLADLLKTAGCVVHEAFDGQQALELAYKTSPDLVISDILMPNLDGFSLCRALRRDVALRDTPVILLSWKEDLLQRVRELGAGAAGYVRKESDTRAIIARVREALRTRGRIEARLREDGEVRGRLDGVSIRSLLEVVCATRPEARVSVRDATFLYEVEIRVGAPQRATRTDGNGGFLKGAQVLTQLLGVSAGRFTVTASTAPIDADLEGNLAAQLAKPIARARASIGLLTGVQTQAVARVRLDEDALADYLRATPTLPRLVARRLANGAPPQELVQCGSCEPALLDDLLCDLAARGIVLAVEAADGTDMLYSAVKALLPHSDVRAAFAPKPMTPSPVPALAGAMDACANPDVPICTSPTPGAASLEDAVAQQVSAASPEPASSVQSSSPFESHAPPDSLAAPPPVRVLTATPPPTGPGLAGEVTATPPAEHIVALGEPTVVDHTLYHEHSVRITTMPEADLTDPRSSVIEEIGPEPEAFDEEAAFFAAGDAPHEPTPFVSITTDVEREQASPMPKRRRWPIMAFLAATGIVAWAVVHFTNSPVGFPRQLQRLHVEEDSLPPPAATALPVPQTVTEAVQDKADEADASEGSLDPAPGKGHLRGARPVPTSSANRDVRVKRPSADESGCTIDARSSRVAHARF